ncbi:HEAT repeat domain-containing protein [Okeania sp. KiyG1]|uniref:HEAT repeat domain-containing protein n=1 Tax=Okeania sp. KiyG1 TaxID=2720165 RepID=UPI0019244646|nr:hypothetical protein CYANOKiyG1_75100 [Okeania sp. KiyG1]
MNTDTDNSLRTDAMRSLGLIKSKEAVEPLINIIKNTDTDRDIRYSAIRALGNIHSPDKRFGGWGDGTGDEVAKRIREMMGNK